jgi:hypothetical protein
VRISRLLFLTSENSLFHEMKTHPIRNSLAVKIASGVLQLQVVARLLTIVDVIYIFSRFRGISIYSFRAVSLNSSTPPTLLNIWALV